MGIKNKPKTVDEFLQQELSMTLEEFASKKRKHVLKKDLDVVLQVIPPHHYGVEEVRKIKAGAEIRVLGSNMSNPLYWPPIGSTQTMLLELFDSKIILRPLKCPLENFIDAVK